MLIQRAPGIPPYNEKPLHAHPRASSSSKNAKIIVIEIPSRNIWEKNETHFIYLFFFLRGNPFSFDPTQEKFLVENFNFILLDLDVGKKVQNYMYNFHFCISTDAGACDNYL